MINKMENPATTEIIIPCNCRTERIVISKFDDDWDAYYFSFYIDSFYAGQSIWRIFIERLKLAWLALRKGNYIHQDLTLDLNLMLELKEDLEKLLESKTKRLKCQN